MNTMIAFYGFDVLQLLSLHQYTQRQRSVTIDGSSTSLLFYLINCNYQAMYNFSWTPPFNFVLEFLFSVDYKNPNF